MTEYTGWDNYVKEQQRKIELEMIPLTDYRTWRNSIDNRVRFIENWKQSEISVHGKVQRLEGKVKDLENLVWNCKHAGIERLQKQVKDLEESGKHKSSSVT